MGTCVAAAIRPQRGGTYRLRAIQAGDAPALRHFRAGLSPDTIYQRYFAPMHLSESALREWAEQLVQRQPYRQLSWVAETAAQVIIALLEIVPDPVDHWYGEMAIAVSDAYQRRGIGTALGQYALRGVAKLGMREIVACLLADNRAASRFIGKLGVPCAWQTDGELKLVRLSLV